MKAKVIAAVNLDGKPALVGSIVEVDETTLRNLVRKGRLEAPPEKKGKAAAPAPEDPPAK